MAKMFDIADLWDVLRIAATPSRAVINSAWVKSLTYSIATSPQGVNVMTSICHMAGFGITKLFKKMPTRGINQIIVDNAEDAQILENYMGPKGAKTEELHDLGKRMGNHRRLRQKWREMASRTNISDKGPLDVIKEVAGDASDAEKLAYADALMPTYSQVAIHYKPNQVLRWSAGLEVQASEHPVATSMKQRKLGSTAGGAQKYDPAWIVVKEPEGENVKYHPLVTDIQSCKNGQTPATAFGYHGAGIHDVLMLLETGEASRLCVEMPRGPTSQHQSMAFIDERGNTPNKESKTIKLRACLEATGVEVGAHYGSVVDCRVQGGGLHHDQIKIHESLDIILNRGRLPAVQPYTSSRVMKCSPIRRAKESGVMVNTVVAYEHMSMIVEASIELSKIDGLKGHQEKFEDGSNIPGFSAHSNGGLQQEGEDDESMTRILPLSNDMAQTNWARDIAERQYIGSLNKEIENFNSLVDDGIIPGVKITQDDIPQQPLPCMGYPVSLSKIAGVKDPSKDETVILQLLSLKVKPKREFPEIEVSDSKKMGSIGEDILMNEVATSLGRKPTSGDIECYKMDRIGENYMWGVEGDLNAYETWCCHMRESMVAKGNADPNGDDAVDCMMDCELMLLSRMNERLSQVKDSPESIYNIDMPWGQTYSALFEKAKAAKNASRNQKNGGKLSKRPRQPSAMDLKYQRNALARKKFAGTPGGAPAAAPASASGQGSSSSQPMLVVTDERDV